jgi:hypothetical protein
MFTWLKTKWANFEAWVHSWFPGAKTRAMTALGTVGMGAAVVQDYVTTSPLSQFVEAKTVAIISLVLFTLSYWFSGMAARVAASKAT